MPAAIGAVVLDAVDRPAASLATVSECIGVTTNNVAEYRALIAGLEAAAPLARAAHARARRLDARASSSCAASGQVKHDAPASRSTTQARTLLAAYDDVDLQHVPRAE